MATITELEKQIKLLENFLNKGKDALVRLRKKRHKKIVEEKEYLTDLTQYIGENLLSICLLLSDSTVITRYNDGGLLYVDSDARLNYSSEVGGIIKYDKSLNTYVSSMAQTTKYLDVIGFFDVKVV